MGAMGTGGYFASWCPWLRRNHNKRESFVSIPTASKRRLNEGLVSHSTRRNSMGPILILDSERGIPWDPQRFHKRNNRKPRDS